MITKTFCVAFLGCSLYLATANSPPPSNSAGIIYREVQRQFTIPTKPPEPGNLPTDEKEKTEEDSQKAPQPRTEDVQEQGQSMWN